MTRESGEDAVTTPPLLAPPLFINKSPLVRAQTSAAGDWCRGRDFFLSYVYEAGSCVSACCGAFREEPEGVHVCQHSLSDQSPDRAVLAWPHPAHGGCCLQCPGKVVLQEGDLASQERRRWRQVGANPGSGAPPGAGAPPPGDD